MIENQVILVDENDREIGRMEKLEAHEKGLLHRAFSVLIFNANNELLLQRRAFGKYHSEGLWTNRCCSHPFPNESVLEAANRRLKEEMGIATELEEKFYFIYKAELDKGLTEYELDHVLIGYSDETPHLNLEEASAFKWLSLEAIREEMQTQANTYTEWFKILINEHFNKIQNAILNESL